MAQFDVTALALSGPRWVICNSERPRRLLTGCSQFCRGQPSFLRKSRLNRNTESGPTSSWLACIFWGSGRILRHVLWYVLTVTATLRVCGHVFRYTGFGSKALPRNASRARCRDDSLTCVAAFVAGFTGNFWWRAIGAWRQVMKPLAAIMVAKTRSFKRPFELTIRRKIQTESYAKPYRQIFTSSSQRNNSGFVLWVRTI